MGLLDEFCSDFNLVFPLLFYHISSFIFHFSDSQMFADSLKKKNVAGSNRSGGASPETSPTYLALI